MLREGDAEGAEAALAEANVLDASNPNAWAYLAIVSLVAEPPRIHRSYARRAARFKRGVDDAETLAELADRFMRVGGWKHAEAAARRAVKHGAGVETRLCLARASRERGDAEGAAAELGTRAALAADRGGGDGDDGDDATGAGAVGVPFLVPELLEELASVYDELGTRGARRSAAGTSGRSRGSSSLTVARTRSASNRNGIANAEKFEPPFPTRPTDSRKKTFPFCIYYFRLDLPSWSSGRTGGRQPSSFDG